MKLKDFIETTQLENCNTWGVHEIISFRTNDRVFLESNVDLDGKLSHLTMASPTDYAVMNFASMSTFKFNMVLNKKTCRYQLRGCNSSADTYVVGYDGKIDKNHYYNYSRSTLRPALHLNLDAVLNAKRQNSNLFQTKEVKNNGKIKYHTMEFGEFPKRFVGQAINDNLLENAFEEGLIKPTGKKYTGRFDYDINNFVYNVEYVLDDQKFVRVEARRHDMDSEYADGTKLNWICDYDFNWAKVDPIVWIIKNWDDLPIEINPNGTGTAKFIDLVTEEAILAGIPFYANQTNARNFIDERYGSLWQNSTIRAYLNGYNIEEELNKGNGKMNCKAKLNFDYTKQNFLTEAFGDEELKLIDVQTQSKKPKRNSYGIEVATGKMSVGKQIEFYINNGQPFMLHGKSGIGKTRRVQDVDPNLTSIILRNGILPEEVIGKTIYPNNSTTTGGVWVPPAWYVDLCKKCEKEPDKKHVLFVDELTNVDEHEQSLVFHIILNNSIGPNFGVLPKNAVVVAAGNSKEESESAYNMTEPLFRRFNAHVYLEPDIKEWLEWANQINPAKNRPNVHPLVSSFVAANKDDVFFTNYDSEEPPKQAIDPRGWEQVSDILYNCNGSVARELIYNKVGKEIGESFVAHLINPPLSVQDVVDGNYTKDDIPHMFDTQYALALSLQYATEGQIAKVRQFVGNHLGSEMLSIFDTVWVGNDDERAIFLDSLVKQENQKAEQDKRREQQEQEEVLELQK